MFNQNSESNFSFQDKKLDQKVEEKAVLDRSFCKAEGILKNKLAEKNFMDFYGSETVREDLEYVAEHLMMFKTKMADDPELIRNKKFATVLEGMFVERIKSWLGPEVSTIIPSRFDEIKNGVDSILRFQEENSSSYLALAIDVTFSKDANHKITKILHKIRNGETSEVKYFESKEFKGTLKNIPKVVIGTDKQTVKELSLMWDKNENDEIDLHPIQKEILGEIVLQLEKFKKVCLESNRKDLAERYDHALLIIRKIIVKKALNTKSIEGGEVYQSIKRYVEKI